MRNQNKILIRNSILHARRVSWETYQRVAADRIALLQNDWEDQLRDWIRSHVNPDAWSQIYSRGYATNININIMQDIVSKVAKLYSQPPSREYIVNGTASTVYNELISPLTMQLNKIMTESLRFSLACGGTVTRIGIDQQTGEWFFHNLTPDQFTPQPNPTNPTQLSGISYSITNKSDINNFTQTDFTYSILDLNSPVYQEIVNGKIIIELSGPEYPWRGENGIPYLPLIYARLGNATNEIVNQTMGLDLYNASIEAGWLAVQREWLTRHQSHKQLVITGSAISISELGNKVLDPTTPIAFGGTDKDELSVQTLDSIADPKRYTEQQLNILQQEASKRGYNLSDFIASAEKPTFESLLIAREQRDEFITSLAADYKIAEKEIASVMIKINNNFTSNTKIPEFGKFNIKFHRSQNYALVTALGFTGVDLVNRGLKSHAELLMEFDPNIETLDEAELKIGSNLLKNRESNLRPEPPQIIDPQNNVDNVDKIDKNII